MTDFYSVIATAPNAQVRRIADVLELRAADPRQEEIRDEVLDAVPFPDGASVLEIGCGTGAVCRAIARRPQVARVVGIDPSPDLLERARAMSPDIGFRLADGRNIPMGSNTFDVVVIWTTLCHVPEPHRLLAEAYRVMKPGGCLVLFDGDYAGTSVAIEANDPLEDCIDAWMSTLVHAPFSARQTPAMTAELGFVGGRVASHGYTCIDDTNYIMTIVDRGADAMVALGKAGAERAASLKQLARDRTASGRFFGQIVYLSLIARKPR